MRIPSPVFLAALLLAAAPPAHAQHGCHGEGLYKFYFPTAGGEFPVYGHMLHGDCGNGLNIWGYGPAFKAELQTRGDSAFFALPFFEARIALLAQEQGGQAQLRGRWSRAGRNGLVTVPIRAERISGFGRSQHFTEADSQQVVRNFFRPAKSLRTPQTDLNGSWETHFGSDPAQATPAIGIFVQQGNVLTGTFRTETGDYRYLRGQASGDSLWLSTFDGSHAYLFTARVGAGDTLHGQFYTTSGYREPWTAVRNPAFALRPAEGIVAMRPGESRIAFRFPNLQGDTVSLADARYRGKVVVLQIMGSWCPNCMDEGRYFTALYDRYRAQGLEVIGLAYEYSGEFAKAAASVAKFQQRLGAQYAFLVAGKAGAANAAASLPMLTGISAFPTSIYIDRQGRVRRIHTGFDGPATGIHYQRFADETEALIREMLAE